MASPSPQHLALVALGGALGAMARFSLGFCLLRPWATLSVNVLGCLAIGVLAALRLSEAWLAFAAVGVLGGFTTFSTFGLDVVALAQEGRGLVAGLYALGSVAAGILAVLAGRAATHALLG